MGNQNQSKTLTLPKHIQQALIDYFGEIQGNKFCEKAQGYYEMLLPGAAQESKGRKKNLENGIYPQVAVYRTLQAEGLSKDQALTYMIQSMEHYTRTNTRPTYEKMGKLPFFYSLFKKMFSMGLKGDSWEVEWISNDSQRFEYNITKCLWHDACKSLGCPELCQIFCRNDEINFTDVSRYLHFKRKDALGYGGKCCDFHFYPKESKYLYKEETVKK